MHQPAPSTPTEGPPAHPRRRTDLHSPGEAFIPDGSPYLGQAILGEPICQSNVLSRTGDPRDETSIRCGHAWPPLARHYSPIPAASPRIWWKPSSTVRNETERRAAPLSPEDQLIQSMPDASPAKWHRAHTTWFFEQFLLGEHCEGYKPFHPDYAFLFNSYYVSAGPRHARHQRGHLTRPGADEITAYRRHVDAAVVKFFHEAGEDTLAALAPLVEVGLNHEQQHQELMLTDILHAFAQNPIPPAYDPAWRFPASTRARRRMGHAQRGHPHHRARRRHFPFRQ